MTGALLRVREILAHPGKPREQLPGQPVRLPARIPQAGAGSPGEEGGGKHRAWPLDPRWSGCPWLGRGPHVGPQRPVTMDAAGGSQVQRRDAVFWGLTWISLTGQGKGRKRGTARAAWDGRKPTARCGPGSRVPAREEEPMEQRGALAPQLWSGGRRRQARGSLLEPEPSFLSSSPLPPPSFPPKLLLLPEARPAPPAPRHLALRRGASCSQPTPCLSADCHGRSCISGLVLPFWWLQRKKTKRTAK